MTAGRANVMARKEAFRFITVRDGDKVRKMPAFQVVWHSLVAAAAKGNGPALRLFFETVQAIEQASTVQTAAEEKARIELTPATMFEAARRIAFILESGRRELEKQKREELEGRKCQDPSKNEK